MDPDAQTAIQAAVDEHGADAVIVLLGAADPEGLDVAATTVTEGDPSFVGPLAGVQLGLTVMHVLEDEVRAQVDAETYDQQVGFVAMTLETEPIVDVLRRARERAGATEA